MGSRRLSGVVALVGGLALLQIAFEDVVVFLGLTRSWFAGSRIVMVVVPLLVVLTILLIVLGGAIWYDDSLR